MKIEQVSTYPIAIKAKEDLKGGTFGYPHYQTVLVKVTVDAAEGWGEAMTRSDPKATATLVEHLGRKVTGTQFGEVADVWSGLWRDLRVRGHTRGVDVEALSGLEMALQDAVCKLRGLPLWKALGGRGLPEVPVFAGSLFSSRGPFEDQVEFAKGRELLGAKVKVGFGVSEDSKALQKVKRLWPDGMLVADANGAYDSESAAKACSAFSSLDLAWFEEPVLSDDLAGYRSLKGSNVRIGAGESWFAGDFQTPIEEGLVGVVEPSVSRCGGVMVEFEAAKKAKARGIAFSPMTGMNSAVSLAASIHLASAVGSIGVEYNPFPNPIQTDLADGLEEPRGGKMKVQSGPGLGIEVDQRFVNSNTIP